MHVHHLLQENSIANRFIAELRDESIQTDRMRFRKNIERVGEILGYELSKYLHYEKSEITTPLGKTALDLPERGDCAVFHSSGPGYRCITDCSIILTMPKILLFQRIAIIRIMMKNLRLSWNTWLLLPSKIKH